MGRESTMESIPRRLVKHEDLVELCKEVYPIVRYRHAAPKSMLRAAHERLTWFAMEHGLHEHDWPDMALRIMLEFRREYDESPVLLRMRRDGERELRASGRTRRGPISRAYGTG